MGVRCRAGAVAGAQAAAGLVAHRLIHDSALGCLALLNWLVACVCLAGLLTVMAFFGRLTRVEQQQLVGRLLKYVVVKIIFAGSLVRPELFDLGPVVTWWVLGAGAGAGAGAGLTRLGS